MSYPFNQLLVIAPIIFILMMIIFPVVGAFAGWKRAAYWGGGNFVFYFIGILIWMLCATPIGALVSKLISKFFPELKGDITQVSASVAAPMFFILFFLLVNILLLINYYAWFKRVVGLQKYKTVKKRDKKGNVTKSKVQVKHNYSTSYKVMSHIVGGVGMSALMIPSVFSFTEATFFLTTSYRTRKNNALANNLFNCLKGFHNKVSWASYYNTTNTFQDMDALYAGLNMKLEKVEDFFDPEIEIIQLPLVPIGSRSDLSGVDALSKCLDWGLGQIMKINAMYSEAVWGPMSTYIEQGMRPSITFLHDSWNSLMENKGPEMIEMFTSENVTEVIVDVIGTDEPVDIELTEDNVDNFIATDGLFDKVKQQMGGWDLEFTKIHTSKKSYDNMKYVMTNCYDLSQITDDEKEQFSNLCIVPLLDLMFDY